VEFNPLAFLCTVALKLLSGLERKLALKFQLFTKTYISLYAYGTKIRSGWIYVENTENFVSTLKLLNTWTQKQVRCDKN
jgi:hypothetical protein